MGKVLSFATDTVLMTRSSLYLVFIVWFYLHCCTDANMPKRQWDDVLRLRSAYDWRTIPQLDNPVLGFAITVMETLPPETFHFMFMAYVKTAAVGSSLGPYAKDNIVSGE